MFMHKIKSNITNEVKLSDTSDNIQNSGNNSCPIKLMKSICPMSPAVPTTTWSIQDNVINKVKLPNVSTNSSSSFNDVTNEVKLPECPW